MGFIELIKLFLSEDDEIVIPTLDESDSEYSCVIEVEEVDTCDLLDYETDNMTELKAIIEKLPSKPVGKAPEFELERNEI